MSGSRIGIGALAPLSRPGLLEAGRHLYAGIELAVEEINETGGIDDTRLELLLHDTAGSPDRGAAAVRDLAATGAIAVVGEYHSVVARAAAAAAVETGIPFVCSSAVLDDLVDPPTDTVARIAPTQSYCWRIFSDYLVAAGSRRVALAIQPDRYWSSGARILESSLGARGVTVLRIDAADLSATAVAHAVAEIGADTLLILVRYPHPATSIVRAIRADLRLVGVRIGDPAGRAEFPDWKDADGVPFLRYLPSRLSDAGRLVEERLSQTLGANPSFVAFEGYDSVQVVAHALRIGIRDRAHLSDALGSLQVDATRGRITFARVSASPVLQWTWPPVQIAVRQHREITVLNQADVSS